MVTLSDSWYQISPPPMFHTVSGWVCELVGWSLVQLVSHLFNQSVGRAVGQAVNQSVNHLVMLGSIVK